MALLKKTYSKRQDYRYRNAHFITTQIHNEKRENRNNELPNTLSKSHKLEKAIIKRNIKI